MIAVGIDVGGTQTRVGAFNTDGTGDIKPVVRCHPSVCDRHGNMLVDWMVRAVGEVIEESLAGGTACNTPAKRQRETTEPPHDEVAVIGLALPGILDRYRHILIRSVNAAFFERRPIVDELAERTGHHVCLMTDAEAATWGEYSARAIDEPAYRKCRPGLRRAVRCFVHLRLGTGVACGVVIEDSLRCSDVNRSCHLDELVIDRSDNALTCPCGQRGCLETVASGPALRKACADAGYSDNLSDLQSGWEHHEETARTIVHNAAQALAQAFTQLAEYSDVIVISVGGGVVTALPALLHEAIRVYNIHQSPCKHGLVQIIGAKCGDHAGVIGAGLLAVEYLCHSLDVP
ncbi:MAG: ROK family protein [Phycisphaerales bacterium]|nr:MAG: ROK family protein [Phycisphaerales bacterium]